MKHIKKWVYEYVEGRIGYWLEEARNNRKVLGNLILKGRRVETIPQLNLAMKYHYSEKLGKALGKIKKWRRIKRFFSKFKWMHIHE
jgi:hypothetical protein